MRGGGGKGLTTSEARREQRRRGFMAGVGRHGGEDETDTRGPCVSGG
jgi:hypothetical protein